MSRASDYANSVSDLYAQIGQARGREAANKGAIWSGALANIGDFVAQYPQRKAQMEEIKNRAALTDLEKQRLQHQVQTEQQDRDEDQKIRDLFAQTQQEFSATQQPAQPDLRGPDDSGQLQLMPAATPTVTRTSPLPTPTEILKTVGPKKAIPIINAIAALKMDPQGDPEKSLKMLQQVANGLNALPEDMRAQAYPSIVKLFEQRGIVKPGALQPDYDSTYWKFITGTQEAPPKPKDQPLVPVPGPDGKPVYGTPMPGAPVYEKSPTATGEAKPGTFEDYVLRYAQGKGKTVAQLTTADIEDARKRYQQADDRPPVTITQQSNDAKDVVESVRGMKDGTIPPQLPGRASREYTALMAEAHRQGVNLVKLNEDWNATQKYLSTLNGQQQTRLRQAITFTKESLPLIESLAKEWDAGKYPLLNRATLATAKNGALGPQAQSLATRLEAQIADLTSELGTVYKGGNSSTDESLALAAKNLQSNWSKQTMLDNIKQIRQNIEIREHSMQFGAPAGVSNNPYAPPTPAAPANTRDPLGIR